jgi:hypothetical protein
MALRNAFDNLSTEEAIRKLANLLTFSRDAADRIRVTTDNSSTIISLVYANNSTTSTQASTTPSWFNANAWNVVDARETQRLNMRGLADNTRKNRWTY